MVVDTDDVHAGQTVRQIPATSSNSCSLRTGRVRRVGCYEAAPASTQGTSSIKEVLNGVGLKRYASAKRLQVDPSPPARDDRPGPASGTPFWTGLAKRPRDSGFR